MSGSVPALPTRTLPLRMYAAVAVASVVMIAAGALGLTYAATRARPAISEAAATRFEGTLLALSEGGSGTTLVAIDGPTGRALGSIALGTSAMAVFRQRTGEILVSDLVVDPRNPARANARLLVLDRSLGIQSTFPLPDRVQYTVYAPAMVLAKDQLTLFYVARVECGIACDDFSIHAFRIDEGHRAWSVSLPRNCGYPELTTFESEVVALCPQLQSIWRTGNSTSATRVAGADIPSDWPIAGGMLANGHGYMITQKGRLLILDGDRVVRDTALVSRPERFSGIQRWRADGRIMLGVKEGGDRLMTALLVLDPSTWRARRIPLPTGSTFAAYMGGDRVAAVHGDGLSIIDLMGSAATQRTQLPGAASAAEVWLIGGGD